MAFTRKKLVRYGAGNLAFRSSFSRLCDYFGYFCNLPPITLAIRGQIVDSNNIEANNTRQQKGKTMSNFTTIEVKGSSDAKQVADTYKALGYNVMIKVNHAAFINSPVRTDNMFIVSISKN